MIPLKKPEMQNFPGMTYLLYVAVTCLRATHRQAGKLKQRKTDPIFRSSEVQDAQGIAHYSTRS